MNPTPQTQNPTPHPESQNLVQSLAQSHLALALIAAMFLLECAPSQALWVQSLRHHSLPLPPPPKVATYKGFGFRGLGFMVQHCQYTTPK